MFRFQYSTSKTATYKKESSNISNTRDEKSSELTVHQTNSSTVTNFTLELNVEANMLHDAKTLNGILDPLFDRYLAALNMGHIAMLEPFDQVVERMIGQSFADLALQTISAQSTNPSWKATGTMSMFGIYNDGGTQQGEGSMLNISRELSINSL